jgi:peroxiredoxin
LYKKQSLILLAMILSVMLTLSACTTSAPAETVPSPLDDGSSTDTEPSEEEEIVFAPDFQLKDLSGETVTLAHYGGKNIILNFWATWCPHCVDEMPDLQRLYETYQDDGLVVLAINIQESQSTVERFLSDHQLDLPVLLDEKATAAGAYGAYAIPLTIAINQEGVLVGGHRGTLSYEQMEMLYDILLESN